MHSKHFWLFTNCAFLSSSSSSKVISLWPEEAKLSVNIQKRKDKHMKKKKKQNNFFLTIHHCVKECDKVY